MALITPFAENGNRTTIPQTTNDGSVSYNQGFGSFYALPPEEGGLFIDRAQFNQLMYDTTSQVLANKSNIATIQGDVSSINNTISQVISSDVTPIGVYKNVETKTIGANGDFKTIQEAFVYAQTHQKQGSSQGITIKLLENLSGDLSVGGAWYPYLTIDCNGFTLADRLDVRYSCINFKNLKLTNALVTVNSILEIDGTSEIGPQRDNPKMGCISALTLSMILVRGSLTLRPTTNSNRSGIESWGGSLIYVYHGSFTQSIGRGWLYCGMGGLIQLNLGLDLTGITVPKANQAANTLTKNGIIFGDYTL